MFPFTVRLSIDSLYTCAYSIKKLALI